MQSGPGALGQAFSADLKATNLYPGLQVVDCAMAAGRLIVTMQHRPPEAKEPNRLLQDLELVFRELMPAIGAADGDWVTGEELPVRLGLGLVGQERPYATYTFTWRLGDAATLVFPELTSQPTASSVGESGEAGETPTEKPLETALPSPADPGLSAGHPLSASPGQADSAMGDEARYNDGALGHNPASESPVFPPPEETAGPTAADGESEFFPGAEIAAAIPSDRTDHAPPPPAEGTNDLSLTPFNDAALAWPDSQVVSPSAQGRLRQVGLAGLQGMASYWGYVIAGIILVGSGVFAYGLTRPCVVGSCQRLDQAADLHAAAQVQLQGMPDGDALAEAEANLEAAVEVLTPVPRWSPYYAEVQADLAQFRADTQDLHTLEQVKTLANQAAAMSQDPPHPVEHWVDTHRLWLQAVERLATIPSDSPVYGYSQQKLKEYAANATAIDRRVNAEEDAEANFNTAIQTAQLAQQRMETATTLAGWQLAAKEWQAAIHGLRLVPQGTMAYDDAQNYLRDYQQQLFIANNRANQEELTNQFYAQAGQAAKAAAAYEAKNQWTLAVQQWQQALRSATRIPVETSLTVDRAGLVDGYQTSLANAQTRLRSVIALQKLATTVGNLCGTSATPCTVSEDDSQIKITLASEYAEPLRQAITPPTTEGQFTFAKELTPATQQLIEQVITTSHQINRQITLYDAYGSLVARYRPDLGGFSKQ
jgi:hypothetical protein